MKRVIIIGLILAALGGGAVAYYMFNKTHDETADIKAAFTVTTDAIVQDFLDDEASASTKYIDQVIEINGPVLEINKTDGKVTGVQMGSDEFNMVNCTFQEPLENIEGETITVKGVCSGFLGDSESLLPGGTVELKRSVVVSK